jgi:hypothetical protein
MTWEAAVGALLHAQGTALNANAVGVSLLVTLLSMCITGGCSECMQLQWGPVLVHVGLRARGAAISAAAVGTCPCACGPQWAAVSAYAAGARPCAREAVVQNSSDHPV